MNKIFLNILKNGKTIWTTVIGKVIIIGTILLVGGASATIIGITINNNSKSQNTTKQIQGNFKISADKTTAQINLDTNLKNQNLTIKSGIITINGWKSPTNTKHPAISGNLLKGILFWVYDNDGNDMGDYTIMESSLKTLLNLTTEDGTKFTSATYDLSLSW